MHPVHLCSTASPESAGTLFSDARVMKGEYMRKGESHKLMKKKIWYVEMLTCLNISLQKGRGDEVTMNN